MKIKKYVFVAFMLLFSFELYSQSHKVVMVPSMGIDTLRMKTFLRECDSIDKEKAINADLLTINKKYKKAFGIYRKLNKKYSNVYLTKKCGDIMLLRKKYDKSLKYFNDAIQRDSLYLMAYLSKINALKMLGRADDKKFILSKIDKLFPYNKKLLAYLISVDINNKDYVAAAKRIVKVSKMLYRKIDLNALKLEDGMWFDVLSDIEESELDNNQDLVNIILIKELKMDLGDCVTFLDLVKKYPESSAIGKLYLCYTSDLSNDNVVNKVVENLEKNKYVSFWQYWLLGDLSSYKKDFKKADSYYTRAIKVNDTIADLYYRRACVRGEMKNYQGVYDDATKAINISPDNCEYYCERAFASIEMENVMFCLKDARRALSINEKLAWAHTLMYRGYLNQSKIDSAYYHVNRMIEIDPFSIEYFFYKAYVCDLKHDVDNCIDSFYRILELDKNNVDAVKGLVSLFYRKKDYGNSISMQERLLRLQPDNDSEKERYVVLLFSAKKYLKALDYIESILKADRGNKMCITKLELLLDSSVDKAVHSRANAIFRNPKYNTGESFYRKAQSISYSNPKLAIQYIDKALSMGVDISDLASLRFYCLEKLVSDKQYVDELNKFINRYPKNADLKCIKGYYLIKKDKKKEGRELLRENLRELNEDNLFISRILVKYFAVENNEMKAKELFEYKIAKVGNRRVVDYYHYMVDFYISNAFYDRALHLLDRLDQINITKSSEPVSGLSYNDMLRLFIYEKSKQLDKWLVLKKKQCGCIKGGKVADSYIKELVIDRKYKQARLLIGKSESKRYCWLDAILLLKRSKHKEAIKCLAKTLDKYKEDKELMKLINYDFMDLSYDFKTRYMKYYIKKMMRDVIKPRL